MELSESMKTSLNQHYNWRLSNVPELDRPVLIVLDYSPNEESSPLSIALDFSGAARCWLSEERIKKIDNVGPDPHSRYRQFEFEQRQFFPFSIQQPLGTQLFENIENFRSICIRLYSHIDWR